MSKAALRFFDTVDRRLVAASGMSLEELMDKVCCPLVDCSTSIVPEKGVFKGGG